MSEIKEETLYERVQDTIHIMLQETNTVNAVYRSEITRAAITLGNIMAPQLHESRLHGENNAVSVAIRCCCEALFWLKMEQGHEAAVAKIEELRAYLASPRIR